MLLATHAGVLPLFSANELADELVSQDSSRLLWLYAPGRQDSVLDALDTAAVWASDPDNQLRERLVAHGANHVVVAPSDRPKTRSSM